MRSLLLALSLVMACSRSAGGPGVASESGATSSAPAGSAALGGAGNGVQGGASPVSRNPDLPALALTWHCEDPPAPSTAASNAPAPNTDAPNALVPSTANLPRGTVAALQDSDLIELPSEGATLAENNAKATRVLLRLPRVTGAARALLALDHFPARAAAANVSLGALLTEWDELTVGTHRLVLFWLDQRGFPLLNAQGKLLHAVRRFHIAAAKPLPLNDWLLVAPAGTLNAPNFEAGDTLSGYPGGLSLLRLTDGIEELQLRVSTSAGASQGTLRGGNCTLSGVVSGDYHFVLLSSSGERLERVVTVNLDLGARAVTP